MGGSGEESSSSSSFDILAQFGMMNRIRTGSGLLDVLLCLFIPLILRSWIPDIGDYLYNYFSKLCKKNEGIVRVIVFQETTTYWWHRDEETPSNKILQRAILNAVNRHSAALLALEEAGLAIKKLPRNHQPDGEDITSSHKPSSSRDSCDSDDDSDQEEAVPLYAVNTEPMDSDYIALDNGLHFMRTQQNVTLGSSSDSKTVQRITYHLKTYERRGEDKIYRFVADALAQYRQDQLLKVDHARYMYVPVLEQPAASTTSSDNQDSTGNNMLYKRYKLSDDKTFASFFHPDKADILELLNNFLNKTGKFAIAGYPQKLGFLLHGPPGTGKTSFIKALAHHTGRSITNIPLGKIKTNTQLMNIMFDQRVHVAGQEDAVGLPHTRTIYVMEDVDAASSVVQRRGTPAAMGSASSLMDLLTSSACPSAQSCAGPDGGALLAPGQQGAGLPLAFLSEPSAPGLGRYLMGEDALNLAGLLNVLDGVVDTPGRIVIMTTNHPEKLDPALIRPGRVNKKIFMGRLKHSAAAAMVQHYFGEAAASACAELGRVYQDDALSPAELENLCAECEGLEQLMAKLAAMARDRMRASGLVSHPVHGVGEEEWQQ